MEPSRIRFALSGLAAFALLAFAAADLGAEERSASALEGVPLVTLAGPDSKIVERGYHRVRDREAWTELWLRHAGVARDRHNEYYNPARIPGVDFDRVEVVAVFQGSGTNSAGVTFVEALAAEGEIVLRFDDKSYQTIDGADRTTAYGLFVLPKTGKPIVLFENVQGMIGHEPVWKERVRLK